MEKYLKNIVWIGIRKLSYIFCVSKNITGSDNEIKVNNVKFYKTKIVITGHHNVVDIRSHASLKSELIFIIGNDNNIEIGDNCILKGKKLHIEGNGCRLLIGKNTTIESAEIACTESSGIEIGEDCMMADDIDIRNGDSHSIFDKKTGKRTNYAKDIFIGKHVWITSHVTVLKGVKIGDEAIIASGAVVTGNVERNSIYGGVPARAIRKNIIWHRERTI
jgi:acetyltransferase-like isoleucine patch superfamily enzyme